ncbi:MAG: gluconate 2-dehydrogenase subunit 3 family protein, partial [Bryobacteraceae bacterium]
DYVKPKAGPFEPRFFSPADFAVIRRLTELILGEGPGAGNNRPISDGPPNVVEEVAEWIDLRVFSSAGTRAAATALDQSHRAVMVAYHGAPTVRDLETFDAQTVCRDGLAWLQDESRSRHKSEFLSLGDRDQLEILTLISREGTNKDAQTSGARFFELIKAEVIRGFYTSQAGLKELNFQGNRFYARSPGCNRT